MDALLAFPWLFLMIALAAFFRPGTVAVVALLGCTSWMGISRLTRAELLSLRNREFAVAARAMGQHPLAILWRHLLPNAFTPVLIQATLLVGVLIILESSLSFLGLGIQPPTPSWGNLIAEGPGLVDRHLPRRRDRGDGDRLQPAGRRTAGRPRSPPGPPGGDAGGATLPRAVNEPQVSRIAPRRRALLTVFLTILLDLIGFGMILPFLTFYAQEFHATPLQIGLLFSSYSLTQLLCAPLLGRLSDRVGRRPVLLASIAGSAISYVIFALAPSYAVLLLARSLSGVAAANYAIAQAYMADVSSPAERSKAMGLVGAAFGLGFVLGPALGGILEQAGGVLPALAHLGPRLVPFAAATLSAINFLIAFVSLPESLSPELRRDAASRGGAWHGISDLRAVWRDTPLRGLMVLFFLVMFCFSMMETTLALFCQARFGFGARETSWLFVFVGVVLVIVQGGLLGRLVRRFGERRLILAGIVLMALGLSCSRAVEALAPAGQPAPARRRARDPQPLHDRSPEPPHRRALAGEHDRPLALLRRPRPHPRAVGRHLPLRRGRPRLALLERRAC